MVEIIPVNPPTSPLNPNAILIKMSSFRLHPWYTGVGFLVCVGIGILAYQGLHEETPDWVTAVVETGDVRELVSVSGFVEAKRLAELSFPSNGTVTGVLVTEGALVEAGDVLATLAANELVAERTAAVSAKNAAEAAYEKLAAGPRSETVSLAETNLSTAKENLARVTTEETKKVANARAALLSTGLSAESTNPNESTPAPTVSGTYRCPSEGSYTILVYGSRSQSGLSYTYEGLESGTSDVSIDQPSPLGSCGIYLLFSPDQTYQNSTWVIDIPNLRSSSYTALNNAYLLAKTQAENAIARAKDTVTLATEEGDLSTAPARSEDLREAAARVQEAAARVTAIDARLIDRSIVAPFSGIITNVSIVEGESAPTTPVITLLSDDAFLVKARVPEIDIRKLEAGQKITAVFDAASTETLTGVMTYVSPVATQIDGVAYFETIIELDTTPTWLRAGLNADIDITVAEKTDVTRIPKRFIITAQDGSQTVLTPSGTKTATSTIEVLFVGNDGFAQISGLAAGDTIVAP
jgi:multidrug efflux pump subunit AcrA (membrane-fusion protein)